MSQDIQGCCLIGSGGVRCRGGSSCPEPGASWDLLPGEGLMIQAWGMEVGTAVYDGLSWLLF
jgi:hypothetical protein